MFTLSMHRFVGWRPSSLVAVSSLQPSPNCWAGSSFLTRQTDGCLTLTRRAYWSAIRPRVERGHGVRVRLRFGGHHEHPADRFERKRRRPTQPPVPWADRVFSILPYLVPLLDSLVYGRYVFERLPIFSLVVLRPLWPLLGIYRGIPFLPLVIFVLLLVLVVRNPRASFFVRFNTMQALTLDIVLILPQLFQGLGTALPISSAAIQGLEAAVFYGILGCILYVVQSCGRGLVPDRIPLISEAAYAQTTPGP
ncbi:hypothetical protein CCYA_CCYA17G4401 [Cyanidiococcus yangmingshanensis]|nr:hypothetical protein CCYA_CCYA17G4401 [Cyanidiococcus yangmingshanensis]